MRPLWVPAVRVLAYQVALLGVIIRDVLFALVGPQIGGPEISLEKKVYGIRGRARVDGWTGDRI
jgi:hypothetical protein